MFGTVDPLTSVEHNDRIPYTVSIKSSAGASKPTLGLESPWAGIIVLGGVYRIWRGLGF
jgi:hypothetical protein